MRIGPDFKAVILKELRSGKPQPINRRPPTYPERPHQLKMSLQKILVEMALGRCFSSESIFGNSMWFAQSGPEANRKLKSNLNLRIFSREPRTKTETAIGSLQDQASSFARKTQSIPVSCHLLRRERFDVQHLLLRHTLAK